MFSKMTKYQQVVEGTTLFGGCRLPPVLIETQSLLGRVNVIAETVIYIQRAGVKLPAVHGVGKDNTMRVRPAGAQPNWVSPSERHCYRSQPRGRALHRGATPPGFVVFGWGVTIKTGAFDADATAV